MKKCILSLLVLSILGCVDPAPPANTANNGPGAEGATPSPESLESPESLAPAAPITSAVIAGKAKDALAFKLYREFYALQRTEDVADAEWGLKREFYGNAKTVQRVKLEKSPDDIETLREWVRLLKVEAKERKKWEVIWMPLRDKRDAILATLREMGEPPPE